MIYFPSHVQEYTSLFKSGEKPLYLKKKKELKKNRWVFSFEEKKNLTHI
jgi:hypothetical protein